MDNFIDTPELFLETVISDTWENKLIWIKELLEYGSKYTVLIPVTGYKYLKIETLDIGQPSFVKAEYHTGVAKNKVDFISLKAHEHPERIQRLILAIRRQQDAKIK